MADINGALPVKGNGTAGTADAAVVTVQGIASMTALITTTTLTAETTKVIGTVNQGTSPWVVSMTSTTITGTVAATQSGTWNITNISGTISLPTGAATETTLAAASAKLPATLGQKAMAASLAVVVASDQSAIPVSFGTAAVTGRVNDYATASPTTTSTSNHDYTVTAGKTLALKSVSGSASGAQKISIIYDPAGTNVTLAVLFTSTANPAYQYIFAQPFEAAATKVVRVAQKNLELSTMDVYSTVNGVEF